MTELEVFKNSLDVSRITMIITLAMAVTTVVFSALTMAFQRSHNMKSTRPFCNLRRVEAEGQCRLIVKNSGLGPMDECSIDIRDAQGKAIEGLGARIRDYTFCSGEEIELLRHSGQWRDLEAYSVVAVYKDIYKREYERVFRLSDI
jgi:hypothetical protein